MAHTYMLVGGGTGGHVTPNVAIAHELKKLEPDCTIVYVLEKHAKFEKQFKELLDGQTEIDSVVRISAGKFRRYYGESWFKRLTDVKTNALNVRDVARVSAGLLEARKLLKRVKPDVVFLKGSFVGLPVGLAAGQLRIPIVTHDSDTMPGLANRAVSRYVTVHASGMPVEFYSYPPEKTVYVGVPLSPLFKPVGQHEKVEARRGADLPVEGRVLLVVGGSNGAEPINRAVFLSIDWLLQKYPNLTVVHQVGPGQLPDSPVLKHERYRLAEFWSATEMARYSAAADVVISRAGATAIAEFALQGKACIVIPNPQLAGGHQAKNAKALAEQGVVKVVLESELQQPETLLAAVEELFEHPAEAQRLAEGLNRLAKPNAAYDIAKILMQVAEGPFGG